MYQQNLKISDLPINNENFQSMVIAHIHVQGYLYMHFLTSADAIKGESKLPDEVVLGESVGVHYHKPDQC